MLPKKMLKAESFKRTGEKIGEFAFPYPECVICMAGAFDVEMDVPPGTQVGFVYIRKGTTIFAACDDYLSLNICPYFLKAQDALLSGKSVIISSYPAS